MIYSGLLWYTSTFSLSQFSHWEFDYLTILEGATLVQCVDVIMLIELGESEIPCHLQDRAGEIKICRHLQGPPLPVKFLQVQVYSNKDAQCNAGSAFFFFFFKGKVYSVWVCCSDPFIE